MKKPSITRTMSSSLHSNDLFIWVFPCPCCAVPCGPTPRRLTATRRCSGDPRVAWCCGVGIAWKLHWKNWSGRPFFVANRKLGVKDGKNDENMGFVVCIYRCLYRSFGTKGGACLMFHVGIYLAVRTFFSVVQGLSIRRSRYLLVRNLCGLIL